MKAGFEQRRIPRLRTDAKAWVRWTNGSGIPAGGRVRAVDACPYGVAVHLEHRIEPYTYVHVECHELKLAGMAVVRHCSRRGLGWVAGLQVASRSAGND
jgi:hypothetical protein